MFDQNVEWQRLLASGIHPLGTHFYNFPLNGGTSHQCQVSCRQQIDEFSLSISSGGICYLIG